MDLRTMTSNRNRRASLSQQKSLDAYLPDGCPKKGPRWRRYSLNRGRRGKSEEDTGTSSRGRDQLNRSYSCSLVDYTDPQRTTVVLEKQDNETFGFEVQTYGLQAGRSSEVEMCTFVCSVQEGSAGESAGLAAGDIILTVNGVSIKEFNHQHVIELIRESINSLKMETVIGSVVKRIELEKKLRSLKQTLHEKWAELQTLALKEKRLTRGNLNISSEHPSIDSLMSLVSPTGRRLSSDSSCLSMATDEGEDASVFDDFGPSSPAPPDLLSPFQQGGAPPRKTLTRTRSISGGGQSPTYDAGRGSVFGTLPRRGRTMSMRKNLLKHFPGLNHSVEEEAA